ncbi:MAG TPA: phosphotransferase [Symbiobacteriaceae bacterium]|nr:phosphotransferase [Symbiobacteriaceae bacterium]
MEQLAKALYQAYGLLVTESERIDFGIWEESFAVWTTQAKVYAKRFLRRDRKTENMLRGLRLSEALRSRGFPAPQVIRAKAGEWIAAVDDERYQVTEWTEGRTYHPGTLPLKCAAHMGALLGLFHRMCGSEPSAIPYTYTSRDKALLECRGLLERYHHHSEPFALVAREVLEEQVRLLERLPSDVSERLLAPRYSGPCFHSFWVEQVIFHPEGQVAALVDWTDGAGNVGFWAADIDTGIHLSALGPDAIRAFVAGYQSENSLPEAEWRALADTLCYGHLASTNFLGGWFDRPYRRMHDWEQTAELWHRQVPLRFAMKEEIEEAVLTGARSAR